MIHMTRVAILIHESTYDAIIIDMRNKNHSKVNLHKLIRYFEDKHSLAKRVIIDEARKILIYGQNQGSRKKSKAFYISSTIFE